MACANVLYTYAQKYLSFYQYETAKFFAERLYYEEPSPVHLNILAQCYYRQNKYKQVFQLLQDCSHPSNRYLFALACVALNKLSEAERALSPTQNGATNQLTSQQLHEIPEGALGLYLLGKVCRRQQRKDAALFYLRKAIEVSYFANLSAIIPFTLVLQADASCWCAIVEYHEMGGSIDISELCGVDMKKAIAIIGGNKVSRSGTHGAN